MHRFTVDYSKDRPERRVLLNRGYFLHGLPRLIALCRLFGHKPTVDGYDAQYGDQERARWVVCDRCGIRPSPQGHLDPDQWNLGQRYTGPFNPTQPMSTTVRKQLLRRGHDAGIRLPGAWPAKPTSDVGAQFIIGRTYGFSADVKVGSPASEQCLAAHISLGPIGALYVHTEDHGRFIQRLLNNTKWESRETGLRLGNGRLEWRLWAPRDHSKKSDPWWMRGSIHINPAHYLFGPIKGHCEKVTEPAPAVVHMPDGIDHDVILQLEKWTRGRVRGRKTVTWRVDWECAKGIPVRNHDWKGDEVFASSVDTTREVIDKGQWVQEACAAIADQCAKDRAHYNYRAPAA